MQVDIEGRGHVHHMDHGTAAVELDTNHRAYYLGGAIRGWEDGEARADDHCSVGKIGWQLDTHISVR